VVAFAWDAFKLDPVSVGEDDVADIIEGVSPAEGTEAVLDGVKLNVRFWDKEAVWDFKVGVVARSALGPKAQRNDGLHRDCAR
jgi:hypothetical protein